MGKPRPPIVGCKKHIGKPEQIAADREWKTAFSAAQVNDLKKHLKKQYSEELRKQLESCTRHYQLGSARTIVITPADEKKRAGDVKNLTGRLLHLLSAPSDAWDGPAEDFRGFLEAHLPDHDYNKLFTSIAALHRLAHEYREMHRQLPRARPADGWKQLLAYRVAETLIEHKVRLGKGRNTTFYNVLLVVFELLGEDSVADLRDYVDLDAIKVLRER